MNEAATERELDLTGTGRWRRIWPALFCLVTAALPALRRRLWEALAVLLPLAATGFFALGGDYGRYYGLCYAAFSIFGLTALGAAVQRAAGSTLPPVWSRS